MNEIANYLKNTIESLQRDSRPFVEYASSGKEEWKRTGNMTWENDSFSMTMKSTGIDENWISLQIKLNNKTGKSISVKKVYPFHQSFLTFPSALPLQHCQKKNMADITRFRDIQEESESHMVTAWTNREGSEAFLAGWRDHSREFNGFKTCNNENRRATTFSPWIDREDAPLGPGEELILPELLLASGSGMQTLLSRYSRLVAEIMGARTDKKSTGWCSWYYYLDTLKKEDLLNNIKAINEKGLKELVDVIQIDDGWNLPSSGASKVWGDWDASGELFPRGMKEAADEIKESGHTPGLWLAPFAVAPESRLFKEHPEWCLQDNGKPTVIYGIHALDLSHPQVLPFIRKTFRRVFTEWDFDYVKLDFIHFAIEKGERYDNSETGAALVRKAFEVIREEAGEDRFILGCGAPFAPLIGLVDAMRTGHDVSSRWDLGSDSEEPDGPYISIAVAAWQTVRHHWMHENWWVNDPDCLITRDYTSKAESDLFANVLKQFENTTAYGLSITEAQFWKHMVSDLGYLTVVSENIEELEGDRLELLKSGLSPEKGSVRLIDWYEKRGCFAFEIKGERNELILFNLTDKEERFSLPESETGNSHSEGDFRDLGIVKGRSSKIIPSSV